MNIDATTNTASVDAAIAYLSKKGALHKLSRRTPVLYKDIVMWRKVTAAPSTSYDLPPLTVTRL